MPDAEYLQVLKFVARQAVQEKSMVVCPDRVKQFNKDFAEAVGDAAGLLVSAGGFALKEIFVTHTPWSPYLNRTAAVTYMIVEAYFHQQSFPIWSNID